MKNFLFPLGVILISVQFVWSQSPQRMTYQAVIRDGSGELVLDSPVGIRVSIVHETPDGAVVFQEIYNPNPETNANGLVTLAIGSGVPVLESFDSIDWSDGPYFLQTEIDPTGGTNYTISGVSQLLSVPYALFAERAGNISNPQFTHYVGELFGGGIVVAVWKIGDNEHGLIASLSDISSGTTWSNVTSSGIGIPARSPRDGQANTNAIMNQPGHLSSAAKLCSDYSAGGFDDWYLPAAWELGMCYNAATIVNEVLGDSDGFKWDTYWSSTETDAIGAWTQFFYYGYSFGYPKENIYRVRAVRRF